MTHLKKSDKTLPHKWPLVALGTNWSIETSRKLVPDVRRVITRRIDEYDRTYSRFREDSLAWQLRTPGEYKFPEDITPLLTLYEKLYKITGGRMTPLIGAMLEQAGYDSEYSLKQKTITSIPAFSALGWDGAVMLKPTEPVVLDMGAAGKGYLVDIIARILERHDINDYTIDASGDIRHRGAKEIIGLEHPLDATKIIGTADLGNGSLCASATNRRTWQGFHHVFDPATKAPTDSLLASWVVADTALLADALATALFFVPASELRKHFGFTYVSMSMDGSIDASSNFEGELFI